jgi:threonine dehydrogenase-like Zn-dependent dehydrogenase
MPSPRVRAAVMPGPGQPIRVDLLPEPTLEPGAALLETVCSEVCGTDVHVHRGHLAGVPWPIIPGHVSVGRIAALRGRVHDVDGRAFAEGDLVTFLDVHETCNACYQCLVARQTTRCPRRRVYGITYGVADGLLGGWAERLWMKPGVRMIRLPDGLDPETFIGGGCGLSTAVHALERAAVGLEQSVAVLGAGPVGQSCVALAALSGAGTVIAVDGPGERLAFARRMGATDTVDLSLPLEDRVAEVRRLTGGRGADVVIEAAGRPEAVVQALDMVRDGGRVVVVGQYTDLGDVAINPHAQINRRHVEIRGCWGSDYSHFHRAVALAARHRHRIPWREMVSRSFGLDAAGEALDAVAAQTVLKAVIRPAPAPA